MAHGKSTATARSRIAPQYQPVMYQYLQSIIYIHEVIYTKKKKSTRRKSNYKVYNYHRKHTHTHVMICTFWQDSADTGACTCGTTGDLIMLSSVCCLQE